MNLISAEASMCIKAGGGNMCREMEKQEILIVLCTTTLS